jgi:carbon monoxide dehydrogenase subunit G
MSTRLERTISVPGEPDAVFAYLADFTNTAEWDPGTVEATQVGDGPVGIGTRFHVIAEFKGRRIPLDYEVKVYDPPRRVVLVGRSERFKSTDDLTVTPAADGFVRIGYVAEFELRGLLRFAEPFLKGQFNKLADDAVAGLEKALG